MKRIPPKELRSIWKEIPGIRCQGKCQASCGPIGCSSTEQALVEDRSGKHLTVTGPTLTCTMLKNGRCTVYGVRPTICRLWGVVQSMRCPWGCKPERVLTDAEAVDILARSMWDDDREGWETVAEMVGKFGPTEWSAFYRYLNDGVDLRPAIERIRSKEERWDDLMAMNQRFRKEVGGG